MLERLRIKNFALIDDARLEFSAGLNVLTGETGAGKSILLGALSVVLGERITPELFRSEEDKLEVEAAFCPDNLELPDWVETEEEILIIIRDALKGKRPQNFLNQRQVTQTSLAELGDRLVDIHGQHQHQLLLKQSTHSGFLDSYAGLKPLRQEYVAALNRYQEIQHRIKAMKQDLGQRRQQRDFLQFQLDEILKLAPVAGESAELKTERELLSSAEKRAELTSGLTDLISEQESSILEKLAVAGQKLGDLAGLDPSLSKLIKVLKEAEVSLDEVWRELLQYGESIEYSAERLEEINHRLFAYEKLCRKHDVDEEGLLEMMNSLQTRLDSIDLDAQEVSRLETEEARSRDGLIEKAKSLSAERTGAKAEFEKAVETHLESLAMPDARMVVELTRHPDPEGICELDGERYRLTEKGLEDVQFLFSANPGEEPKPLTRVASGGEISRIMLAIKTVLINTDQVPVLVFDEIDVGIGGKTAETVGKRLKELAAKKQILLVTHLHQIARYADRHFQVSKRVEGGRTITQIKALDKDERIDEIARMLGGEEISETVKAHAQELLEGRQ